LYNYLPSTDSQKSEMLKSLNLKSIDELYSSVPHHLIVENLDIPEGISEFELVSKMKDIANKNTVFATVFRGAGAYRHFIPSIVKHSVSKESFVTAYTPYQPEISQGILQSIFEYQTNICELTGMDVSNASVYDGASAAAEAVSMCRNNKRTKALISGTVDPRVISVIKTYCDAADAELVVFGEKDGLSDLDSLVEMLDETVSSVYIQQPNFYGLIEDCVRVSDIISKSGAKFIMGVNPIAMAILKTPGEVGADIAVGEGQPLGMPLSFGGPFLGFMASKRELLRNLPGRIVGQTKDKNGKRAFVLTLQAREQHIRRDKATSNICSNQALCATTASAYLAAMGPNGLLEVAKQCLSKAHYLKDKLTDLGFSPVYKGEFFHEFLTYSPVPTNIVLEHLEKHGILGGLPLGNRILWCATEVNTRQEIDRMVALLAEVVK